MFLRMGCFCLRLQAFCYSIAIAGVAWQNTMAEQTMKADFQELLVLETVPIKISE